MRSDRPGIPGPQAADAAHDQVDRHAGLAREVELLDQRPVHQAVHLGDDARGPARAGVLGLAPDARRGSPSRRPVGATSRWRKPARARVAGQQVEELGDVLAEGLPAGEEAEVAVDAAGAGIVVAGGQVAVAPDPVRLLADHEAGLAVRLVAGQPVDHVGAHLLERARPADVGLLVEARLQLDEDRDLLAVLGGQGEGLGDRRGRAHAVERHLDGEHPGVHRGLAHEAGDRVEGVVRVVREHVAAPDRAPDVGGALEGRERLRRAAAGP